MPNPTHPEVSITKRGYDVIRDPLMNKGTAFTTEERDALGLHGLLPAQVNDIDVQVRRVMSSLNSLDSPLEQYLRLGTLQNVNEHLYYRVLADHIEELMPIVYTPTVGLATQMFSQVFRRGRGIWITPDFRGCMEQRLRDAVGDRDIHLIVATDNESILGIGDQGAGGMAISIGKLALYVAGAGIPPWQILPVSLDVGTNNKELLEDDLYLGLRKPRIQGAAYDELIDEFVEAVKTVLPNALVQWEDFRKDNALAILDRHRQNVVSFNDDIQGTGAVALAGLLSGLRISGAPLGEQRVLIYGAGAAGLGIARQIKAAFRDADHGQNGGIVAVLDSRGLLVDDQPIRDDYKRELAWSLATAREFGLDDPDNRDLAAVVECFKPTVLIGSSGQPGAFSEDIVRTMADSVDRPIIMPFSNPTHKAEAVPADLILWTDGRALIATGSPFEPVEHHGRSHYIGQGNNVFVFPGLGLGALVSGASEVTDAMVTASSAALAHQITDEELALGLLFPSVNRLREVSREVARAVVQQARNDNVAADTDSDIDELLESAIWSPEYPNYQRD
ncbi:MAG: NAD-dependent malic enzyme [Gammaproteobacteria bacterium]|nr:NAD-dependent malic enzyme [Gammaproteobacteria bacterium]